MFRVTKEQFLEAVKAQRPDLAEEFIEPDGQGGEQLFIVEGKTLVSVALRADQRMIWVTGVLGAGLEWLWELQKLGLANGYEWIGFKVKKGLPWGRAIVRFSKAKLMAETPSGDEYCASLLVR